MTTLARRIVLVLALAAPTLAPSAGRADFLSDLVLPESQERAVAEAEHPKIVAEFGGIYADPALERYVQSIATFLGRASRRPDIAYRVTILNSPIVNAFALPAGYLYVTRGLLALANDEAELAGVLAHEIGHVTARHTAQRYSRAVVAESLLGLFGMATEGTDYASLGQLLEPIAQLALRSYSREQEHEADALGVRTMARAGYAPEAMARFLSSLEAHSALEARLHGEGGGAPGLDLFATHPRTAERVRRTIAQASDIRVDQPMRAAEIYLSKIDGMIYGDDPSQGFVRGRVFAHPGLGLRFEVPEGYALLNGRDQVLAQGPDGAMIRFDLDRSATADPSGYLVSVWAKGARLTGLRSLALGGLAAATARTTMTGPDQQTLAVGLVAVRLDRAKMARFLFAAPTAASGRLEADIHATVESFRLLTAAERAQLKPFRLKVVIVRPADTLARLAASLPFAQLKTERLRVLNGLGPEAPLPAGAPIKTLVAQ